MLESFPYVMFHDLITMSQQTVYILTSVWVLRMPNAVFDVFNDKKLKKEKKARNLQQNLAKKGVMKNVVKMDVYWLSLLFKFINTFSPLKTVKT